MRRNVEGDVAGLGFDRRHPLAVELEVTSLLVTHDVEGGLLMCDRVAMLDRGTLRFCGTPEEFRDSDDPVVRAFGDRAAAEAAVGILDV